jgi:hypothetical protein
MYLIVTNVIYLFKKSLKLRKGNKKLSIDRQCILSNHFTDIKFQIGVVLGSTAQRKYRIYNNKGKIKNYINLVIERRFILTIKSWSLTYTSRGECFNI